jgi:RND family efflux transporter MFP subunit
MASAAWAERPPAPVQTAEVFELEVADERTFVGNVAPTRTSIVGNEFAGLVVEFLVHEGDRVAAQQPLARLRTTVLQTRLDSARAELAVRKAVLAELENGSRPEAKREARARLDQAAADLELKRWKLQAAERLRKSKTISIDELREAELAVRAAEEREKEAQAALELVEAGPRKERIDQARADVSVQAAAVARLEEEERRHTIRAPFEGYVVSERTQVGQWLAIGDPVVEIAALDQVDVVIPVLEDFIGGLSEGTTVAVSIGALPGEIFTGRIHRIVPRANPRARTFPVKIRFANARVGTGVRVKAGMFARVKLAVGEKRKALAVPKDALVLGGPRPVVFRVDPKEGTVAPVPVELGVAHEGFITIQGALQIGQRVVVRGNERLRPGQRVRDTGPTPNAAPDASPQSGK